MRLSEARAEAERYLAHLEREKAKSIEMQKLASLRRAGKIDAAEAGRRMHTIQGRAPTVYDGGELARAVRVLLDATKEQKS